MEEPTIRRRAGPVERTLRTTYDINKLPRAVQFKHKINPGEDPIRCAGRGTSTARAQHGHSTATARPQHGHSTWKRNPSSGVRAGAVYRRENAGESVQTQSSPNSSPAYREQLVAAGARVRQCGAGLPHRHLDHGKRARHTIGLPSDRKRANQHPDKHGHQEVPHITRRVGGGMDRAQMVFRACAISGPR